ncbi:MAG: hypothetical protein KJ584_00190, partial [Candidatus Omnitrophica bacterium]|nr:hypothetical protein [Candidatus Omnitrophota bacterium]
SIEITATGISSISPANSRASSGVLAITRVQNEIFVWLDSVAFYRDRFDAGVSFDILKEIKGDVYYRLQSTKKSGRWTDHNILGLKLKVLF